MTLMTRKTLTNLIVYQINIFDVSQDPVTKTV